MKEIAGMLVSTLIYFKNSHMSIVDGGQQLSNLQYGGF